MDEIGRHYTFEKLYGEHFHNTDLLLSSGRNSLRYIIRERKIKKIYLPYFLCESLSEVCIMENVKICYYHINDNFMPLGINKNDLNENSFLYFVNYYGIFRKRLKDIIEEYKYVIIDNTHDFFNNNSFDVDIIYNYRKYFGVPDGACIVSSDLKKNPNYANGKSLNKIIEMISRDEEGEFFHYKTFLDADKYFKNEDLVYMSNFTNNYIKGIDYNKVLNKRLNNYRYLKKLLINYNSLVSDDLTYMYPLYIENGDLLRKYLLNNNIYSLMLWPNVMDNGCNNEEKKLANNIVLLPIDQRYDIEDMLYIGNCINKYFSLKKNK